METYSCFSHSALSKSVKVLEELLDSDSVFQNLGLQSDFNIEFNVNHLVGVSQKLCVLVAILDLYRQAC